MKRFIKIIMLFSFAVALCACEKEIVPVDNVDETVPDGYTSLTLSAVIEQTRTTLDGGVTKWASGDQIKVICSDNSASSFSLVGGEGTNTADFTGYIPEGKTALYAVYPASRYSSVSGSTVKVDLPASKEGDFGSGNVAVAKVAGDYSLAFRNVNSFIGFTLPGGTDVTSVVVESVGGANLGGVLSVDCSGEYPEATTTIESGISAITVTTSTGAGTYYVPIAPDVTHAKGFKLSYKKGDDVTGVYYLNRNITTVVNTLYTLGEVETNGNYYVTVDGAGNKNGMNWDNAFSASQMWKKLHISGSDPATDAAKVEAINGATFHLGAGTYNFGASPTILFSESSPVSLTFKGGYPAAGGARNLASFRADITGNNEHEALILRGKLNVTFEGIGFVYGSLNADNTGALDINGSESGSDITVTMSNCLVDNNNNVSYAAAPSENHAWGAGIYVEDASLTAESVVFSNNHSYGGAALYVNGSASSVLTDCSFTGNASYAQGGAAIVYGSSSVTFNTCSFTGNTANNGGAIYSGGSSTFTINGSSFGGSGVGEANHAGESGGAILSDGSSMLTIQKSGAIASCFEGNYCNLKGGAIRNTSSAAFTCTDALFDGNHTDSTTEGKDYYGGALSLAHADMVATITDCTLENNYGAIYGGAALSYQSGSGSGSLTVNGTTFENNYSNYTGDNNSLYSKYCGAIRLGNDGTKCYFNDCTFIGNHAKTNTSDSQSTWGGAVCYYGDDMIYFNRCYFEGNYATRGGAISSFKCGGIYMNACSFKGNYISWKNGTTIMVEQTTKFCMNNCSIYDDTYTTSSGGDFCNWVYLQGGSSARKMQEYVISNCSMIARSTSPIATMSGDQESLYILNSKDGSTGALINNILVLDNDASAKNDWWLNLAPMNGYNNIEKKRGWNGNTSYTGSNDTLGKGASDFGNLNWENNAWTWNGTLAGGYTPITADNFATYLNAASSDFKVWLTSIGALNQDQLGHNRGTGSAEWWPGAYQN